MPKIENFSEDFPGTIAWPVLVSLSSLRKGVGEFFLAQYKCLSRGLKPGEDISVELENISGSYTYQIIIGSGDKSRVAVHVDGTSNVLEYAGNQPWHQTRH